MHKCDYNTHMYVTRVWLQIHPIHTYEHPHLCCFEVSKPCRCVHTRMVRIMTNNADLRWFSLSGLITCETDCSVLLLNSPPPHPQYWLVLSAMSAYNQDAYVQCLHTLATPYMRSLGSVFGTSCIMLYFYFISSSTGTVIYTHTYICTYVRMYVCILQFLYVMFHTTWCCWGSKSLT